MHGKIVTDIEQSKKLAEILPIESSDTFYKRSIGDSCNRELHWKNLFELKNHPAGVGFLLKKKIIVPAWSLAALLDYLKQKYYVRLDHDGVSWSITCIEHDTGKKYTSSMFDDPIDACWGMVLRLNKEGEL